MLKDENYLNKNNKQKKGKLKFAVIGHVEWVNFLKVDYFPKKGIISHAKKSLELPAGGGVLIARTLFELTNNDVHFFTSLGKDLYGQKSYKLLKEMGLKLHVSWRDEPTRKGFSLIDKECERSITIIGKRLSPLFSDNLDWEILRNMDGVFITAGDENIFKTSREAKVLCTTPRAGIQIINDSEVLLDGLIGSKIDPDESFSFADLKQKPRFIIKTEGEKGCISYPGGHFDAIINDNPILDSYGCGDSFAAGILFGMSSDWSIEKTIKLGTVLGRNCIENFGPYPKVKNIINQDI
tara:strand:- start:9633 stop:10517 length:885 start_codon:yes stop_codon:yes gene_type:complete